MSDWKIFASKAELIEHPNADSLVILKIGRFSIVAGKQSGYKNGDIIVFAPSKSILPEEIRDNYVGANGASFLRGPNKDRVGEIRLRGELSMGVSLDIPWVLSKGGWNSVEDIPLDEDISEKLGIKKYEIPIPVSLAGKVKPIEGIDFQRHHDVEQFRLYKNEFQEGEIVICSEKLHGSMVSFMKSKNNNWVVTSKGIGKKGLVIEESAENSYWQAFYNFGPKDIIETLHANDEVQIFGELLPVQSFKYGQTKPKIFIFRIMINGQELEWDEIENFHDNILDGYLVPTLYEGPFDEAKLIELSKGMETLSGKQTNIREGIVVRPFKNRRSKEGFNLFLKVINPKYVESGEEFN